MDRSVFHLPRGSGWVLAAVSLALAGGCSPARGVPIFLWHAVGEGTPGDGYDVPAAEFERELSMIDELGAKTVTLDQLFDSREGGKPLPQRAVILTFDDGRACLYTAAMPLLLQHRMTAEVFVVTDWVGADAAHRVVRRDEHGLLHPYLVWAELDEMVRSGAFRVESHSKSHRKHTELSLPQMHDELVESRRILQDRLKVPAGFFAYPFGGFNTPYRDEVESVGYRAGLTVDKGPGTRFALLRHSFWRDGEGAFRKALVAAFGTPPSVPKKE